MIFCFSGTGNSAQVAQALAARLDMEVVPLDGDTLLRPARRVYEAAEGEDVVWVFPIYSWGVPPIVERFIRKVKIKGHSDTRHWMVATCGDDIGRADDRWRQAVGRRGWTPAGAFSVRMPNTYVNMRGFEIDDPALAAEKVAAMPARVDEVVAAMRRGFSGSDVVRGGYAWLKTAVVYPFFRAFCMDPRGFSATDACRGCGGCARRCPAGNITMADGRPVWGPVCAMCLRCLHGCPAGAIEHGKHTRGKARKPLSFPAGK